MQIISIPCVITNKRRFSDSAWTCHPESVPASAAASALIARLFLPMLLALPPLELPLPLAHLGVQPVGLHPELLALPLQLCQEFPGGHLVA